ncbi:MAG: hypothetical protein LBQ88_19150 [Treponema sp.]|nr:hypothetical protein [Treponema sp.]
MYEIVPSGTLSAWKKGQEPRAYTICNLANFLGTSIDFLLTGKDKSSITSEEQTLLIGFRQLDTRDREDLLGNLQMKLDNAKKGDIISNSGNA